MKRVSALILAAAAVHLPSPLLAQSRNPDCGRLAPTIQAPMPSLAAGSTPSLLTPTPTFPSGPAGASAEMAYRTEAARQQAADSIRRSRQGVDELREAAARCR